jgi:hypothetical protein
MNNNYWKNCYRRNCLTCKPHSPRWSLTSNRQKTLTITKIRKIKQTYPIFNSRNPNPGNHPILSVSAISPPNSLNQKPPKINPKTIISSILPLFNLFNYPWPIGITLNWVKTKKQKRITSWKFDEPFKQNDLLNLCFYISLSGLMSYLISLLKMVHLNYFHLCNIKRVKRLQS